MTNKYNVRAIRNELDNYIRNRSWKKFRIKFQSLIGNGGEGAAMTSASTTLLTSTSGGGFACKVKGKPDIKLDLIHGIIKDRNNDGRLSLLQSLCYVRGGSNRSDNSNSGSCSCSSTTSRRNSNKKSSSDSTVPIDVLEMVLQACPHEVLLMSSGSNSHSSSVRLPISLAIERKQSTAFIECLLRYTAAVTSTTMSGVNILTESYYNYKNFCHDTLLLQAIHSSSCNSDLWKLLIEYDADEKESLLIPRTKKDRTRSGSSSKSKRSEKLYTTKHVPLYFVAKDELHNCNLRIMKDEEEEEGFKIGLNYLDDKTEEDEENEHEEKNDEIELPEDFVYMLLQTYHAVLIRQEKRRQRQNDYQSEHCSTTSANHIAGAAAAATTTAVAVDDFIVIDTQPPHYEELLNALKYYHDDDKDTNQPRQPWQPSLGLLLQAAIVCVHYLSAKNARKVLYYLLSCLRQRQRQRLSQNQNNDDDDIVAAADRYGNNLIHLICQTPTIEGPFWLEDIDNDDRRNNHRIELLSSTTTASTSTGTASSSTFLELFLSQLPSSGLLLKQENKKGKLPLNLAIETGKSWKFLQVLCAMQPQIAITGNALHTALKMSTSSGSDDKDNPYTRITEGKICYELWKLHPDSASIQDPTTKLYPFQLAAAVPTNCVASVHDDTPWIEEPNTAVYFGHQLDTQSSSSNTGCCTGEHKSIGTKSKKKSKKHGAKNVTNKKQRNNKDSTGIITTLPLKGATAAGKKSEDNNKNRNTSSSGAYHGDDEGDFHDQHDYHLSKIYFFLRSSPDVLGRLC